MELKWDAPFKCYWSNISHSYVQIRSYPWTFLSNSRDPNSLTQNCTIAVHTSNAYFQAQLSLLIAKASLRTTTFQLTQILDIVDPWPLLTFSWHSLPPSPPVDIQLAFWPYAMHPYIEKVIYVSFNGPQPPLTPCWHLGSDPPSPLSTFLNLFLLITNSKNQPFTTLYRPPSPSWLTSIKYVPLHYNLTMLPISTQRDFSGQWTFLSP